MNRDGLFLGAGDAPQHLLYKYANRHGLVAGATGTGKTVTLQVMAQGFSDAGVPVFCADMKGDLAGIAVAGEPKSFLTERAEKIGLENFTLEGAPVIFWDLFGKRGHPMRATISEMGPVLLSRLLDLNDTQSGVLNIAFKYADDEGLLLLDFKDLQALLAHLVDNRANVSKLYGQVAAATVGAIQRQLLVLQQEGAEHFFAEPALEIADLMRTTRDGRGYVNILAAEELMNRPRLYATFLLWLLSELFEQLPEVGDLDKPRLVFFFDEAHLLFSDTPKALIERVERVARLIRSKGVGVYFVTQSPADVPNIILSQLGNRVQHALRAFTPQDQRAVNVAADTFRQNPNFETREAITQLGVGEALVSVLEDKGIPSIVERTLIRPPSSRMGPISDEERARLMAQSPVGMIYDRVIDRESAYEILAKRAEDALAEVAPPAAAASVSVPRPSGSGIPSVGRRQTREEYEDEGYEEPQAPARRAPAQPRQPAPAQPRRSNRQTVTEAAMSSLTRSIASGVGRAIVRGVLGSMTKR